MSKKKIFKKHLEKGRFYIHSDGHGGHPALLFKKRDNKNFYVVLIFTSSPGPKRRKLKHSIEPSKVKNSFVHNSPSISKRRDLGSRPLKGIKIHKEDKPTIKLIEKKNDSPDHEWSHLRIINNIKTNQIAFFNGNLIFKR